MANRDVHARRSHGRTYEHEHRCVPASLVAMNAHFVRFSRHTLVAVLATGSIYARNIILLPVLTRSLSQADYGAWVQVVGLVDLLSNLACLGLGAALVRFVPRSRKAHTLADDVTSGLVVGLAAGSAMALLMLPVAPRLAGLFLRSDHYVPLLRVMVLAVPFGTLASLMLVYFKGSRKILTYSVLLILEAWGVVALALALIQRGWGVYGVVASLLLFKGLVCATAAFLLWRQRCLAMPSFTAIPGFLRYSLPLLPLGVFQMINNVGDRYIISLYWEPQAAGVYAVSYAVGSLVGLAFAPVFYVLGPALAEAWEDQREGDIREYFRYAQKYSLLLALPATAVLALFHTPIITLLSTSRYLASPYVVICVALGIMLMNVSAMAEILLHLQERTRVIPVILGSCAMVNIIANLLIIPRWGYYWAAVTTLATYGLQFLLTCLRVRSANLFSLNTGCLIQSGLATLCLILVVRLSGTETWVPMVRSLLSGGVSYVVALYLLGSFEQREWILLRSVLNHGRN